jgi:serine/threonine protein kinase
MILAEGISPLGDDDPSRIGEFRLSGRLGGGGMGQVFLGFSPGGRAVAVKLIHPALAHDQGFRERFRREVAAARQVSGIYTAPVVAAGPDDTIPWLATAFVPGPSLAHLVATHGPLPPEVVWKLAGGLAEALSVIHSSGLVHRDLKPANVLLATDGPRVIDFGISQALGAPGLTTAGVVVGTPAFMSPEQAQGMPASQASDVFALGAVLAFAAAGTAPFGEGTPMSVLHRLVSEPPDLGDVPEPLRDLILRCLAKDAAERPALSAVLQAISTADGAPAGASFWPEPLLGLIRSSETQLNQGPRSGRSATVSVAAAPSTPSASGLGPETAPAAPSGGAGGAGRSGRVRAARRAGALALAVLAGAAIAIVAIHALQPSAAASGRPAPTAEESSRQPSQRPSAPSSTSRATAASQPTATRSSAGTSPAPAMSSPVTASAPPPDPSSGASSSASPPAASSATSPASVSSPAATVCQGDGTGCTKAGTYRDPNVVISADSGGFEITWTSTSVQPYSSGDPLYWTAGMTYKNVSSATLQIGCPAASGISEYMADGKGDDGYVPAMNTSCGGDPGWQATVLPGDSINIGATFHNVPWPGCTVSVTLGGAGSSPAIYPFT